MTKKRIFFVVAILFLFAVTSYSQVLSPQEQAVEDDAFLSLTQKKYKNAGEHFSQLLSLYGKNASYNFYYGVCLVEQNKDIDDALRYIKYAEKNDLNPDDAIELDYYLGRVYHLNYNFDKAIEYYNKFKDEMGSEAVKYYDIDREIRMATNGKELIQYISDLTVVENKKISISNYYYSYKLSNFGGKLLIKPDEYKTKADKKLGEKQLMFLSDSGIVYYASYGKKSKTTDIYQRKQDENGEWGEPQRLPNVINTQYDDRYPYLHADGMTLYFASKGHSSMGGYDIFKSVFDTVNSQWTEPVNMDFPTNTPYDDYLYISDVNDEYAYFSSNRETTGDKISVYKIIIDKDPTKRQIESIDDIKAKSLLQVSPLALQDETKVKNSEFLNNSNKTNSSENVDETQEYNFERLSISDVVSVEAAVVIAESDEEEQEVVVVKTNDYAENALVYSYIKYSEADELNMAAEVILSQENLSETDKQQAELMKKDARLKEEEAILAYNVYNNLHSDLTYKKEDSKESKNVTTVVKSSDNVQESVDAINGNREKSAQNKEKYFEINKESSKRKEELVKIESELEIAEENLSEIKVEIDQKAEEIKRLTDAGKIDEAQQLSNESQELIEKYKQVLVKKDELVFKENKLNNEINFLSYIDNNRSTVGKAEVEEKIAKINIEEFAAIIDERSIAIDVEDKSELNDNVEKQTETVAATIAITNNTNHVADNNTVVDALNTNVSENVIADNTEENNSDLVEDNGSVNNVVPVIVLAPRLSVDEFKNEEAVVIVQEVNNNAGIIDSLNTIIIIKKDELNKEPNIETKQKLEQDISELETIVELKTTKNELLLTKANNIENASDDLTESNIENKTTKSVEENNIEQIAIKDNEINVLYVKLNKNIALSDSLESLSNEKKTEAENTVDESKKEILFNEAEDLAALSLIKKNESENIKTTISDKETELNSLASNVNPVFEEEKTYPFAGAEESEEVTNYKRELFKQKYYETKVEDLEKKKVNFELTKKSVTTIAAKEDIDNQIKSIDTKIKKNSQLAVVAKLKSEELKKTIEDKNILTISDEELYAEATVYNVKNEDKLNAKDVENINFTKSDIKYANDTYKDYKLITKQINELELSLERLDGSDKQKVEKEIKNKKTEADILFLTYNNTIKDAHYVEYENLESVINNYVTSSDTEKSKAANKLRNDAKAYYIKANAIRLVSNESDKSEVEKAISYEKIAINKEKQALDIYIEENVKGNNVLVENENRITSVTLSLEDEEIIEEYNKISYKEEKEISEKRKELLDIELQLISAKEMHSSKKDKIVSELEAKQQSLQENLVSSLGYLHVADSLKYSVYKAKIEELDNIDKVTDENKLKAAQYSNQAEYFYSNAQILRLEATKQTDIYSKLDKLDKAKVFENIALFNQENAYNIMLENDDNIFTSTGNIIKIDPLLQTNKIVSTADVQKATREEILSKLKLTEEDAEKLDKVPELEHNLINYDFEIENLKIEIEELKKSIILTDDPKGKAKYQKKIDKAEDEIYGIRFVKAEEVELVNDSRFYVYKSHLSKNKLKDQSDAARKGNQLSKDANKYYSRAKTLRNKSEMVEDLDRAYAYLLEANELELEGIDAMERAYSVYMGIQPNQLAEELSNKNEIEEDEIEKEIVEYKVADITVVDVPKNIDVEKSDVNNTIADSIETVNVDENDIVIVEPDITETSEEIVEEETVVEEKVVVDQKPIVEEEVIENKKGESEFENFSVYPVSVYTNTNPIPVNPKLPEGIVFKVQVGAFKNKVREDAFNGLSPLAAEKIAGSTYTRYLVGQFQTYEGVKLALNEVKTIGYKDAFVVAYKNGKRIPLYIARDESKQSVANYNDVASAETANVKNRNKTAVSDKAKTNNSSNADETNGTVVKAGNIKSKNNLLYTVQIGVYTKAVSHAKLYNLNPIFEDVTEYGYIRYTTGIFNDIKTAKLEKDRIRKLGIKDAFVTAYYKGKKISINEANRLKTENVDTENNQTIVLPQVKTENKPVEKPIVNTSNVRYKIQIGAYKSQVPLNEVKAFLSVSRTKNLEQFVDNRGYTVFAIGSYDNYTEAAKMKTVLINEGIKDAFIVAYNGNTKISVTRAKELLGK